MNQFLPLIAHKLKKKNTHDHINEISAIIKKIYEVFRNTEKIKPPEFKQYWNSFYIVFKRQFFSEIRKGNLVFAVTCFFPSKCYYSQEITNFIIKIFIIFKTKTFT